MASPNTSVLASAAAPAPAPPSAPTGCRSAAATHLAAPLAPAALLRYAAKTNGKTLLQQLVDQGFNIHNLCVNMTMLAAQNGSVEVLQFLEDNGGIPLDELQFIVHDAVWHRQLGVLAWVSQRTRLSEIAGRNVMQLARFTGHSEVIEWLAARGYAS